ALHVAEYPARITELSRSRLLLIGLRRLGRALAQGRILGGRRTLLHFVGAELTAQVHPVPRRRARLLALGRSLLAPLLVLIERPHRAVAGRIAGLRRRKIAGRRHHERRALLIIDAGILLAVLQAEAAQHALEELGVGQLVVIVVLGQRMPDAARDEQQGRDRGRERMMPEAPARKMRATAPVSVRIVHGRSPSRHRKRLAELKFGGPSGMYIADQGAFAASRASVAS